MNNLQKKKILYSETLIYSTKLGFTFTKNVFHWFICINAYYMPKVRIKSVLIN